MTTMKQQIARKQDGLNRLKDKDRKLQTGQKIILQVSYWHKLRMTLS